MVSEAYLVPARAHPLDFGLPAPNKRKTIEKHHESKVRTPHGGPEQLQAGLSNHGPACSKSGSSTGPPLATAIYTAIHN